MRQPLLDAVRGLDPAADGPEIDGEAMLARIREEVHSAAQADVTHLLPPRRSRPAQRLAMGAAALTVVVAVAIALVLTSSGPRAYATWAAEPTLVPVAEAAAECPDTEPGTPPVPVEPVLAEQRGSYTFVVLSGEGVFVRCLASTAGEERFVVAEGARTPSPSDLELGTAPVLVLDPGAVWAREAGEGPITTVVGLAADDVTAVEVSTVDGVTAEASLDDGWWLVWFPGDVEIADGLLVTTPDGESTLSLAGLIAPGLG